MASIKDLDTILGTFSFDAVGDAVLRATNARSGEWRI